MNALSATDMHDNDDRMNLATFSGNHKSMPFLPFMANVVKEEGIKGLYSGLPAGLLRQVPVRVLRGAERAGPRKRLIGFALKSSALRQLRRLPSHSPADSNRGLARACACACARRGATRRRGWACSRPCATPSPPSGAPRPAPPPCPAPTNVTS